MRRRATPEHVRIEQPSPAGTTTLAMARFADGAFLMGDEHHRQLARVAEIAPL